MGAGDPFRVASRSDRIGTSTSLLKAWQLRRANRSPSARWPPARDAGRWTLAARSASDDDGGWDDEVVQSLDDDRPTDRPTARAPLLTQATKPPFRGRGRRKQCDAVRCESRIDSITLLNL